MEWLDIAKLCSFIYRTHPISSTFTKFCTHYFLEGPKVIFCLVSKHDQICLLMVIVEYNIASNFISLLSLSWCHPDDFVNRTVQWVSDLYFFTVVPRFYYQLVCVSVDVWGYIEMILKNMCVRMEIEVLISNNL